MLVRLSLTTHFQVCRPGVFTVLIEKCTSPHESRQPERVSRKLTDCFRISDEVSLNPRAAEIGVRMAQGYGFLTENCFWGWKGHVLHCVGGREPSAQVDQYLRLADTEKICFLKYYLEAQGAVILEIAKLFRKRGIVLQKELLETNWIESSFGRIWQGYLQLSSDLAQRVELRNQLRRLERRRGTLYTPKVRRHKVLPHVRALIDMGLLEMRNGESGIEYRALCKDGRRPLAQLADLISSLECLEAMLSRQDRLFQILGRTLGLSLADGLPEEDVTFRYVAEAYAKLRDSGTSLVRLTALGDLTCAQLLVKCKRAANPRLIQQTMEKMKSNHPHRIRFHLDRHGRRAFVVFQPELVQEFLGTASPDKGSA